MSAWATTPWGAWHGARKAGTGVSFRYDGMDRLREVVNEAGAGYVFRRDLAGNISSEKDYGGIERIYRDGCGRVTRIDRPGGAAPPPHTTPWDACSQPSTTTARKRNTATTGTGWWPPPTTVRRAWCSNATRWGVWQGRRWGFRRRQVHGRSCRWSRNTTHTASVSVWGSSLGADTELSYDRFGLVGGIKATVGKPEADDASAYGDAGGDVRPWGKHHRQGRRRAWGGAFRNRRIRITTDYNDMGLVRSRHVRSGNRHTGWRSYRWDVGARLMSMRGNLSPEPVIFDYDSMCNLVRGRLFHARASSAPPDKVGNLYREDGCKGREYDRGGRLLWDGSTITATTARATSLHKSRRDVSVPEKTGIPERKDGSVCCSLRTMPTTSDNGSKDRPVRLLAAGWHLLRVAGQRYVCRVRDSWRQDGHVWLWRPSADGCQRGRATPYTVSAGTATWCCMNGTPTKPTGRSSSRTRPGARNTTARRSRTTLDMGVWRNIVHACGEGHGRGTLHDSAWLPGYADAGIRQQGESLSGRCCWMCNGKVAECHGDRTLVPFRYQGSTRTGDRVCTTTASATTPRKSGMCIYPQTPLDWR